MNQATRNSDRAQKRKENIQISFGLFVIFSAFILVDVIERI